jgi:tether containing UBX domain for GLUT4
LEFVCSKHPDFAVDQHELRHHNKVLDVSVPFRFSGLPNNAQLEMVQAQVARKTEPALIGLNLESGERVTGTFSPGQTLQEVIDALVPEKLANPVVIYMRKEVFGEELGSTTLKMCGITSGRAMMRLVDRKPEELKQQANVSVTILPKPPKEEPERPRQRQSLEPEPKSVVQMAKETLAVDTAEKMEVEQSVAEQVHSPSQPSTSKKSKLVETEGASAPEPVVEHQIITVRKFNYFQS